jgi:outer membrane protein assembly factor BamE (lipoprotein component of BamABCDE complex)
MTAGLMAGLVAMPASAEDAAKPTPAGELAAARAENQKLRERVAALEAQCPDTSAQQPPPADGVAGGKTPRYLLKRRWDQLESGMEKDEVYALLGRPGTVTRSAAGQVEIWGYGSSQTNRYGTGTVYFDDDEEVTTWMSPTFKTH